MHKCKLFIASLKREGFWYGSTMVYHGLAGFVAQLRICFLSENDSNLLSQFPGPQILTSTKINPFLFWIQSEYLKKS